MKRYRNTWAEVDLGAIKYNIEQLRSLLPEERKVMTVVKADGYGHGSLEVTRTALAAGVDYLMVALLEEAVYLREHGIDAPIVVIGRVPPTHVKDAVRYNVMLTAYQVEWVQAVNELALPEPVQVHVEFETGMNRTGVISKEELIAFINEVKNGTNVHITGAYTHFATADEVESDLFKEQYRRYHEMLDVLMEHYDEPIITHVGNSAAGIQYAEKMLQYTRFGVSIYGLYPSRDIRDLRNVELKQAFSLYSELMQVKKINAGEAVSYGATYRAEEDTWIGTIPIGYGDGYSRSLQGFYVLIDGKKMPIVGRICMDAMMVQLDKPYPVGQKVTLIGEDHGAMIEMDDVAEFLGTINYEIPCMLTSRVPREYIPVKVSK